MYLKIDPQINITIQQQAEQQQQQQNTINNKTTVIVNWIDIQLVSDFQLHYIKDHTL